MQVIIMITLLVLFAFFILSPETVFSAAQSGISLWWDTLVPSLLPFFILNDLLAATGSLSFIGKLLQTPLQRLFHLPGETAFLFLSGYSTGAPVTAGLVSTFRKQQIISRKQANILLPATANVSPGFILSAVAASLLRNEACGSILLFACYGSNLLMATVLLLLSRQKIASVNVPADTKSGKAVSVSLFREILFRNCKTLLFIGGTVIVCNILFAFITSPGIFESFIKYMPYPFSEILTPFGGGIMEITVGSQLLSETDVDFGLKLCLTASVLAFGGLSAAMQIQNEIRDTDISIGYYLVYKIIQGAVAFTISLLISIISVPVWAGNQQTSKMLRHQKPFLLYFPEIYLLLSLILLLFRFPWDGEH